ncbi:MAG TPA: autotransporter assembly complex family protein [Devosiaceae bacterium]|nr:autotransporter assembly complex family protein [Devosiaceae bacterium]
MSIVCLAFAACGVAASPARAFDFFGLRLFEGQQQADEAAVISDPQPFSLSFSTSGATGDLDSAIRNASSLLAGKDKPASGMPGLLALARGDYQSINAALYGQGYYGGTIHIQIAGKEAATVEPDATLPHPVPVSVIIDPGPQFRFGHLSIANQAPPTADPAGKIPSPEAVGFLTGQPALSGTVLKAEQAAVDAWKHLGYADAAVTRQDVVADHRTNTVDVAIAIAPGRKAVFGAVSVKGTQSLDPAFVARQTGLKPGEQYDPDAIDRANKRLTRLEAFRSQRIAEQGDIGPGGVLPMDVIVQEMPGHRYGVGANYSTIDGLGLNGYWLARNLFGEAERLQLDAKIANIAFPIDTSAFDYSFGGTFTKPGVFNPDTDFVATATALRDNLPDYDETSVTGQAGLDYAYSDQLTLQGAVTAQRSNFDDDFGIQNFATAGLLGEATYDTRDSKTDPTSGVYLDATIAPYYEFYFGNPQLRATAEARGYYGFGDAKRFVLAGRLQAGVLAGPAIEEIPPDQLFFAGGGDSVRGYAYKSIGVENPDGTVTGGRYMLDGSIEARMRINDTFGAAAFVDGGYVADELMPGFEDVKFGAGVGIRYYTGFGPIRADIAMPLDRGPDDPAYALYLGLGQAF